MTTKKLFLTLVLVLSFLTTQAQQSFSLPKMNTSQRVAIAKTANQEKGLQVFDTNTNTVWSWNGDSWTEKNKCNMIHHSAAVVKKSITEVADEINAILNGPNIQSNNMSLATIEEQLPYNAIENQRNFSTLSSKGEVLVNTENIYTPELLTGNTGEYMASLLHTETITLERSAILFVSYTVASNIYSYENPNALVTDGKPKMIGNYFTVGTDFTHYGITSQSYTNSSNKARKETDSLINSASDLLHLPAGTYHINFYGTAVAASTGSIEDAFRVKYPKSLSNNIRIVAIY